MVKPWRVSLRIARDDHAPLTDEVVGRLSAGLADDRVVVDREGAGSVVVRVTVDAREEWAARSAAEAALRAAADAVWGELELPPFTITFMDVAAQSAG